MINFFSNYKIIFYFLNFSLIFLYLFPGSFFGLVISNDISKQPQITPDFIVSSNHFYVFLVVSFVGFFTFQKKKNQKFMKIYLLNLSIILELFHLVIPARSFQWSDLFGNLLGVVIVIFINNFINKHGLFKK
tara:strand:- start:200 stop:595 length:396 start_codon:yes stop_codon:yes gene_type:complete